MRIVPKVQLLLLLLLAPLCNSFGQSSFEGYANRFTQAWYRGDSVTARKALSRMYAADSMQTYRYVEEAHALLDHGPLSPGRLDTLCGIYNTAIDHDTEKSYTWLLKKAFLQLKYPQWAGDQVIPTLEKAFFTDPQDCPAPLIEVLAEKELDKLKANDSYQTDYLRFWGEFHQKMMLREAERPNLATETATLFNRIYHESRAALPDCDRIWARYIGLLKAGNMQDRDFQSLLVLLNLQNCNESELWDAVKRYLNERDPAAWYYRQAASFALNREEYELSQQYLLKSLKKEENPQLKATDQVKLSLIWRQKGDRTRAVSALEQAMDLNRAWGRPYLHMAELIEDAAKDCPHSDFEKKALYWLAIDYCLLARNVDPQVRDEANQMLYRMQTKAPTPEEIQFRGLQSGDSYPLRCWRQRVTTVKVF